MPCSFTTSRKNDRPGQGEQVEQDQHTNKTVPDVPCPLQSHAHEPPPFLTAFRNRIPPYSSYPLLLVVMIALLVLMLLALPLSGLLHFGNLPPGLGLLPLTFDCPEGALPDICATLALEREYVHLCLLLFRLGATLHPSSPLDLGGAFFNKTCAARSRSVVVGVSPGLGQGTLLPSASNSPWLPGRSDIYLT